jgi:selenoprotein W-related protein
MTETLLQEFEPHVEKWTLIPSGGGRFEVTVNEELIYSKARTGRHPEIAEIRRALQDKLG